MMMIMMIIVIDGCFSFVVCYISSIIISSLIFFRWFFLFLHYGKCWVKSILAWSGTINMMWWSSAEYEHMFLLSNIISLSLLLLLWTSMLFAKYIIFFHIISIYKLKYTLNSHHHYHLRWLSQCSLAWNKNWFELIHSNQVTFNQISSIPW